MTDGQRRDHYGLISNSVLWPLFHGLHTPVEEVLSNHSSVRRAWGQYRAVNQLFADRIATVAQPHATAVVHDYQLLLVPGMLQRLRPDLNVAYFHHIPFSQAAEFSLLPKCWRREIVESLSNLPSGFQSPRWRDAFLSVCESDGRMEAPDTIVSPVGVDIDGLRRSVASPEVAQLRQMLRVKTNGRKLVARIDRADPMKNVLGGLQAIDQLLSKDARWLEKFVFWHHLVPTRDSIDLYKRHQLEVLDRVGQVNEKWGNDRWKPVDVNLADQRAFGLALMAEYDVLLVNPLREGMNLVALEGSVVNDRNGVVVLSREAGAYELLQPHVIGVDPKNTDETVHALASALSDSAEEKTRRARGSRSRVETSARGSWHDVIVEKARQNVEPS